MNEIGNPRRAKRAREQLYQGETTDDERAVLQY